jgi:hypothetical protein
MAIKYYFCFEFNKISYFQPIRNDPNNRQQQQQQQQNDDPQNSTTCASLQYFCAKMTVRPAPAFLTVFFRDDVYCMFFMHAPVGQKIISSPTGISSYVYTKIFFLPRYFFKALSRLQP